MSYEIDKKDNFYIYKVVIIALVLLLILLLTTQKVYASQSQQNIQNLYILKSSSTQNIYKKNNNLNKYIDNINQFKKYIDSFGKNAKVISSATLDTLSSSDILFVSDTISLSSKEKNSIKNFLNQGGNLFFNYTAGFSDENGNYLSDKFVNSITKLTITKKRNFISFGKNGAFLVTKLLSPFSEYSKDGKLLDFVLYDKIPLYEYPKNLIPDIRMSAYNIATPPISKNFQSSLKNTQSGIGWHGNYGKGKWAYFSFPSYSFYDTGRQKNDFREIFASILNYLSKDIVIEQFPYIDRDGVVFVSEDTEYKFSNFKKFANLAKKYKLHVTAFIVSDLAKQPENIAFTKEISKNNTYVEFASHSATHQKIVGNSFDFIKNEIIGSKKVIDKISKKPLIGFRPPREELDEVMKKHLAKGGYRYVLAATAEYLYPKFDSANNNLLIIPRHGADDYSYLINLDWNQEQILTQIKKEVDYVTTLNGIYTLSLHTHLMLNGSNSKVVDRAFSHFKKYYNSKVLDGRSLAKRVVQNKNIKINKIYNKNQTILEIKNLNTHSVKNFTLKVFKNPNIKIKRLKTNSSSKVILKNSDKIIISSLKAKSITKIYIQHSGN